MRRDNWWRRALGRLSARRETVARWGAHAARARPGLGTQRGMVRQYNLLAQERARVKREMAEEERKFLGSWQVFERSLKHDALKRPLAKGWIPQVDGVTGRRYYLNLKTGELHKIHPNLHNMLPQIAMEREKAKAIVEARLGVLGNYARHLELEGHKLQSGWLEKLASAGQQQ